MVRQLDKSELLIERAGLLILGIDNHRHRRHRPAMPNRTVQSIKQQKFANALPSKFQAARQAADPCRGKLRISRKMQFLQRLLRKISRVYRVLRKRVVARDVPAVRREHEDRRYVLLDVLGRLLLEVVVKSFMPTGKGPSVVLVLIERLDEESACQLSRLAHLPPVTFDGGKRCLVRLGRVQKRLHEDPPFALR
jgi:hypothetical protein